MFNKRKQDIVKGLATHITLNYHETLTMAVSWSYNIFSVYAIESFRENNNNLKESQYKNFMCFALYSILRIILPNFADISPRIPLRRKEFRCVANRNVAIRSETLFNPLFVALFLTK